MAFNPAGAVRIHDGGAPKIITGYAREALSGGQLAYSSGTTTAAVSSGLNSFVPTDILFAQAASGGEFNGVVITPNVGSNNPVAVALDGVFILTAAGNITPGNKIATDGGNAVIQTGSAAANLTSMRHIGRALTGAGSEGYVIANIFG